MEGRYAVLLDPVSKYSIGKLVNTRRTEQSCENKINSLKIKQGKKITS